MPCEVCGKSITGPSQSTLIDEANFITCESCAKLGKPGRIFSKPSVHYPKRQSHDFIGPPTFEIQKDFHKSIRLAREKMNLSQEELGRRTNEKLSLIKLIEVGKMKPTDSLARKLENILKIKLMVPYEGDI
tara:strand:+ start:225 stop:617 length:393 start_codon:yes stop_codon:yes gene_type:complete